MKERLIKVLITLVNIPIVFIWMVMMLTIIIPVIEYVITGDDPYDFLWRITIKTEEDKWEAIEREIKALEILEEVEEIKKLFKKINKKT